MSEKGATHVKEADKIGCAVKPAFCETFSMQLPQQVAQISEKTVVRIFTSAVKSIDLY